MLQKILVPIIQGKLFFLADYAPPKDIPNAFYFNIDQDLVYQPFYEDFGPLNIAKVWKYINEIHKILTNPSYSKSVFYHQTSLNYKKCCNSILLICSYQVVMMKKPAQQAFRPFQHLDLKPFRDASYGNCSYKCTILDCLMGLEYAIKLEWFCFKKFDLNSYEHFEQLENGDLNWIIPDKLIGFSSPYDKGIDQFGNKMLSPKDYLSIFKKLGVKTVIRFNSPTYDRQNFTQNGINHYDLFFADGTPPSLQIVQKFLEIVESAKGAVAVHCKAGLGRTGCLIACYAMKHYKFSAAAFIGWIRLCRPGSILGPQQHFLVQIEENMHEKSDESPIWKQLKKKINPKQFQTLHLSMKKISGKQKEMNDDQTEVSQKGQHEQGKRLVEAKKHNHYVKNHKVSAS